MIEHATAWFWWCCHGHLISLSATPMPRSGESCSTEDRHQPLVLILRQHQTHEHSPFEALPNSICELPRCSQIYPLSYSSGSLSSSTPQSPSSSTLTRPSSIHQRHRTTSPLAPPPMPPPPPPRPRLAWARRLRRRRRHDLSRRTPHHRTPRHLRAHHLTGRRRWCRPLVLLLRQRHRADR